MQFLYYFIFILSFSCCLNVVDFLQIQREGKLLQSTGNHHLNRHTNGKTELQKCQIPCGFTNVMLESVDLSQKYPLLVNSLSRFFFSFSLPGVVILDLYLPCLKIVIISLTFVYIMFNTGSSSHKGSWI